MTDAERIATLEAEVARLRAELDGALVKLIRYEYKHVEEYGTKESDWADSKALRKKWGARVKALRNSKCA